ncbi:MAG TPA: cupin domain-containing protein [Thermoanaerobaculia bacterium]|jgi:quercetin dioxygenase-like cupin family protein
MSTEDFAVGKGISNDGEAGEDPGAPAPGDATGETAEGFATARDLANFGAEESAMEAAPPTPEDRSVEEGMAAAAAVPTIPLDLGLAQAFLDACTGAAPRVAYGLGAKVPFHGAVPGKDFKAVDCSGFVRELIWRATPAHQSFPDGSVVQHDWIRDRSFEHSTPDAALQQDGAVRIAFLRPQDSPSHVGHVVLIHNARTLESHGGVGPDSRAWTKAGWQGKTFVYVLNLLLLVPFILGLLLSPGHAQAPGITAKPLLHTSVSGDDTKEAVVLSIEFASGSTTGRHTHPGDEYATVLQGSLELHVDGQEPRRVNAGEAYHNARGIIHETRNIGTVPARTIATFIVEKGKPITQPVK